MSRHLSQHRPETVGPTSSRVELVDASFLDDLRLRLLSSTGEGTCGRGVVSLTNGEVGAILLSYGILVRALRRVISEDDPRARSEAEWILARIRGGDDPAH